MRPRWRLSRAARRLGLVVALLALGAIAAFSVASGRTSARWYHLEAAKLATVQARRSGAERWAPDALRIADMALRRALAEHRHQEIRFYLLRDFRHAEALLRRAEELARRAALETGQRRRRARDDSEAALARAAAALGHGEAFARAMRLPSSERSQLQRSRIGLEEARLLHARGEHALALARAVDAERQAHLIAARAAASAARYTDPELVARWRRWVQEAVASSRRTGRAAIIVLKEKHELILYERGKPVRIYVAELGSNSVGDKERSGDNATPEGRYKITRKKPVGESTYHMALLLDYPNEEDRRRFEAARRAGRVPRTSHPGNLIEIHGDGGQGRDWTKGCVALVNRDMEDLYGRVEVGTPVTIVGGDGGNGAFTDLLGRYRAASNAGMD